jgi:hypothetical protein
LQPTDTIAEAYKPPSWHLLFVPINKAARDYQHIGFLTMALQIDREAVPGTEQLIDGMQAHAF